MEENNKGFLALKGTVRKKYSKDPKSGDSFVLELFDEDVLLKREGGKSFPENFLEKHEGKNIVANGYRIHNDFFVLMVNGKEI